MTMTYDSIGDDSNDDDDDTVADDGDDCSDLTWIQKLTKDGLV